jgi:hypothetical protein
MPAMRAWRRRTQLLMILLTVSLSWRLVLILHFTSNITILIGRWNKSSIYATGHEQHNIHVVYPVFFVVYSVFLLCIVFFVVYSALFVAL